MFKRPFYDLLPTIECDTPRTVLRRLTENPGMQIYLSILKAAESGTLYFFLNLFYRSKRLQSFVWCQRISKRTVSEGLSIPQAVNWRKKSGQLHFFTREYWQRPRNMPHAPDQVCKHCSAPFCFIKLVGFYFKISNSKYKYRKTFSYPYVGTLVVFKVFSLVHLFCIVIALFINWLIHDGNNMLNFLEH